MTTSSKSFPPEAPIDDEEMTKAVNERKKEGQNSEKLKLNDDTF